MLKGMSRVLANLDRWRDKRMAGVQGVGMIIAAEAAKKSKANRPWKDDTHNAKQGLYGKFRWEGTQGIIEHGHRVNYGVWLELAHDGKYAILEKTLNELSPEFRNRVKQIMEAKI